MARRARPIACLENGGQFSSAALAAKWAGCSPSSIHSACKEGIGVKGHHFYFADEPKPEDSFFQAKNRQAVVCVETGVVYESMREAARNAGCSQPAISRGLLYGHRAGGHHWERAGEGREAGYDLAGEARDMKKAAGMGGKAEAEQHRDDFSR